MEVEQPVLDALEVGLPVVDALEAELPELDAALELRRLNADDLGVEQPEAVQHEIDDWSLPLLDPPGAAAPEV